MPIQLDWKPYRDETGEYHHYQEIERAEFGSCYAMVALNERGSYTSWIHLDQGLSSLGHFVYGSAAEAKQEVVDRLTDILLQLIPPTIPRKE